MFDSKKEKKRGAKEKIVSVKMLALYGRLFICYTMFVDM